MLTARTLLLLILPFLINFLSVSKKDSAKLHTVLIKEMTFQPNEIKVQKGDVVVWVNKDIVTHNVTDEKKNSWHSPPLLKEKSWRMVVKESSSYYCSLHPVMKGKIILQ